MAFIYIRDLSPCYWIGHYDKNESDPAKKKKNIPTKIRVTTADRERRQSWIKSGKIGTAPKAHGNKEIKDLLNRMIAASVDIDIEEKTGLTLKKQVLLSQGLAEFLSNKPQLAPNTIRAYELAVWHLIEAIEDKPIVHINYRHYNALQAHFKGRESSLTTRAINSRHLHALWQFFVKKRYAEENIIIVLKAPKKAVEPIPFHDMQLILDFFHSNRQEWEDKRKIQEAKEQYYLIYFLLLTGFRISSALIQTWERIDLESNVMIATNVKAKNKIFYFPIHPELKKLLVEMVPGKGHLFSYSYRKGTPAFWKRNIKDLADPKKTPEEKRIKMEYHIHDLRKTFTSWMINAGVDQSILQKLLDHSDIRTTDENYSKLEATLFQKQFDKLVFKK